jgi:hypothetical protein
MIQTLLSPDYSYYTLYSMNLQHRVNNRHKPAKAAVSSRLLFKFFSQSPHFPSTKPPRQSNADLKSLSTDTQASSAPLAASWSL